MDIVSKAGRLFCLSCSAIAVAATVGCCRPLIRSERFAECEVISVAGGEVTNEPCDLCQCSSAIDHFFVFARAPHALLPGSMPGHRQLIPRQHGEAVQDVPHSKFHPVPTRPVFASREAAGPEAAQTPTAATRSKELPLMESEPGELELRSTENIPAPVEFTPDESQPHELRSDESKATLPEPPSAKTGADGPM